MDPGAPALGLSPERLDALSLWSRRGDPDDNERDRPAGFFPETPDHLPVVLEHDSVQGVEHRLLKVVSVAID